MKEIAKLRVDHSISAEYGDFELKKEQDYY